jgi:photosystem II stability/assembly factor-like uncharacterized protein
MLQRVLAILAACAVLSMTTALAAEPVAVTASGTSDADLKFRFLGPRVGNRVAAITGVPGEPSTYYAGAASGGVWKSVDGGNRWDPIFDRQSAAAIGALAVAPSDTSTVWAGTGEAWMIRDADVAGDGVYKSTDAGRTWTNMGLPDSGRIGRIIVHPTDAQTVFVCALGRATGPSEGTGVFRTQDGGAHWQRVLDPGPGVGCSGLAIDPHNPRVLYAGTWQVELHTWAELSGGPGSGVWTSRDGGTTWKRIEHPGLPKAPVGKVDVAVAPSDGNRVYALMQTKDQGSLWRSDDAGATWKVVNHQRALIGRAGYYIRLAVSPTDANEVLVANSSFHQSLDGGENFHEVPWGGDTHDIWIDPKNPDRFSISDDLGLIITTVHGRGFHRVTLPIGQTYHVAVDRDVPYRFYSNMQDDGNFRGPVVQTEWGETGWDRHMGGCESGFTIPDTVDSNVVWATCYGNSVTRWDARYRQAHSVSPWMHTLDSPPNGLKYRCHWTSPLAIDPFDHETVYYGCQKVLRTQDQGRTWSEVSPDLSTQNPARIVPSGGIVGDNLGQFYGAVVFAIAPSTVARGLIWAGTNDGQVWVTKDAAATWTNVTRNLPGLPPDGTITSIAPSSFDAGTAIVAIDLHLVDNRDPYLYKTTDFGRTWKRIDGGLPRHALSYVRTVVDDPNARGLLFVGTGNALHYSLDDGAHWKALEAGLPHSPVSWAVVQPDFHDLVVSTYGRGIWVLEDLTPLEARAAQAAPAPRLYPLRPAYRLTKAPQAIVSFELDAVPKAPVTLDITDAQGTHVRHLEISAHAGLNRTAWDLRYDSPRLVALRTKAPDNPHIWNEPRFRDIDSRPITHWGAKPAEVGPIVVPGAYTVALTIDGHVLTQTLTVRPDPHSPASAEDLNASVASLLRVRDDISAAADTVNRIEWMRKQLEVVDAMLASSPATRPASAGGEEDDDDPDPAPAPAIEAGPEERRLQEEARAFAGRLADVEAKLVSRALQNSDDKYFVEGYGAYLNLIWLNAEIGTGAGDVAGSADFKPTVNQLALLEQYESEVRAAERAYEQLIANDLPRLSSELVKSHRAPVATPAH